MGTNLEAAQKAIEMAAFYGVREFCVCAGSRNSPLVAVLCLSEGFGLFSFADERAAAFFALGRARASGRPVAVVTTSGTAAAELLPAAIEAHYSGVPLLLITADRPRRYRGTGAPQSIEQNNLFGPYVEACLDLEAGESWDRFSWSAQSPLHLNLGFDEPLIDGPVPRFRGLENESLPGEGAPSHEAEARVLIDFVESSRRPVVILGALEPRERAAVRGLLLRLGLPVYAEAISGLREDPQLARLVVRSGERMLPRGGFDAVLRLGGVPTLRFWRDLEAKFRALPVLSLSRLPFAGLSRGEHLRCDVAAACAAAATIAVVSAAASPRARDFGAFFAEDLAMQGRFLQLLASEPASELALVNALSRVIPEKSNVFLGNSLAVREWDLASVRRARGLECVANRGANGIDGEVSTFFGHCALDRENWAVLGDLTALYDLSGPWIADQLGEDLAFQIVVLNNGGGRIFSRLPSLSALQPEARLRFFENAHDVRFEGWARLWNLGFETWERVPALAPASRRGIVELRPDFEATQRVWEGIDELWRAPS